jgi:hypothetical protein
MLLVLGGLNLFDVLLMNLFSVLLVNWIDVLLTVYYVVFFAYTV